VSVMIRGHKSAKFDFVSVIAV